MGRGQRSKGGGYAWNKGNETYVSGVKCGGGNKKTVGAATALRLGVPQQNMMRWGLTGLGMVQQNQNPLDSFSGSVGMNAMAGLGGFNTSLQSANSGNGLLQLPALPGVFAAAICLVSASSAPAGMPGACTTTGNAGRGTSSRNTETNRGRSDDTRGRACEIRESEGETKKRPGHERDDTR